jgi:hypothetical protein
MQQERSFLRRLCFLKIDIYEPKFNARRAYCSIPLAVKTSRPHINLKFKIQNSKFKIQNSKFKNRATKIRLEIPKYKLQIINNFEIKILK